VILLNNSDTDFTVNRGDRVAQLIVERISMPAVVEVETLDETVRGAGGFGSSGVAANSVVESDPKKQRNA
jgi:dUTP pyrophosphatase